jgi:hypothetical protein
MKLTFPIALSEEAITILNLDFTVVWIKLRNLRTAIFSTNMGILNAKGKTK